MALQFHQGSQKIPDMRLYSVIVFLREWFKGKYVVENVNPYYKPLIQPTIKLGRHLFWTNFPLDPKKMEAQHIHIPIWGLKDNSIDDLFNSRNIDPGLFLDLSRKEAEILLNNYCDPEIGHYILKQAMKQTQTTLL